LVLCPLYAPCPQPMDVSLDATDRRTKDGGDIPEEAVEGRSGHGSPSVGRGERTRNPSGFSRFAPNLRGFQGGCTPLVAGRQPEKGRQGRRVLPPDRWKGETRSGFPLQATRCGKIRVFRRDVPESFEGEPNLDKPKTVAKPFAKTSIPSRLEGARLARPGPLNSPQKDKAPYRGMAKTLTRFRNPSPRLSLVMPWTWFTAMWMMRRS